MYVCAITQHPPTPSLTYISIDLSIPSSIYQTHMAVCSARELCNTPEWWTLALGQGMEQSDLMYKSGQGELGSDGQTAPLVVAIRGVAECTNTKLRSILFESFDFMRHCFALKQYLMLGQGDMIQYLMDLLATELALPAQNLHRHNLNAQLETAIRASNASNDPDFVLERLDVHILEASAGDTGKSACCLWCAVFAFLLCIEICCYIRHCGYTVYCRVLPIALVCYSVSNLRHV
jgi:hypothetical protein